MLSQIYKNDPLANECVSGATPTRILLIIYDENLSKHSCLLKLFNIPPVLTEKIKQKYDVHNRWYIYVLSNSRQLIKL